MAHFEKYSIVWKECGKNSKTSKRFYVPEYEGSLPFFLSGQEVKDIKNKKSILLKETHLLKGILYGLSKNFPHSKLLHQKPDKKTFLYLLDVLTNGFKFESPEKMVLDIAHGIREKNGSQASTIILEVGSDLIPESSKIKSDLICDLWTLFSENEDKSLLTKINHIIPQVDLDDIHSDAKQVICYYGLCAMVFWGEEDDLTRYLEKYVYPNITLDQLKRNIVDLLENPDAFTPKELTINNMI
jgi:hypothetical protein